MLYYGAWRLKMKNITHEHMKKFCNARNCKLYTFEPINDEKTEYHCVINTGFGKMPEFKVTKNQFVGIGENKCIDLSTQWLKFQNEIRSIENEPILGL